MPVGSSSFFMDEWINSWTARFIDGLFHGYMDKQINWRLFTVNVLCSPRACCGGRRYTMCECVSVHTNWISSLSIMKKISGKFTMNSFVPIL